MISICGVPTHKSLSTQRISEEIWRRFLEAWAVQVGIEERTWVTGGGFEEHEYNRSRRSKCWHQISIGSLSIAYCRSQWISRSGEHQSTISPDNFKNQDLEGGLMPLLHIKDARVFERDNEIKSKTVNASIDASSHHRWAALRLIRACYHLREISAEVSLKLTELCFWARRLGESVIGPHSMGWRAVAQRVFRLRVCLGRSREVSQSHCPSNFERYIRGCDGMKRQTDHIGGLDRGTGVCEYIVEDDVGKRRGSVTPT